MGQRVSDSLKTVCLKRITCFVPKQCQRDLFLRAAFAVFLNFVENVKKRDAKWDLSETLQRPSHCLAKVYTKIGGIRRVSYHFYGIEWLVRTRRAR